MEIFNKWNEFYNCGCHIINTAGKKQMPLFISIAKLFQIPFFVIFDLDENKSNHIDLNKHIFSLLGLETAFSGIQKNPQDFNTNNLQCWEKDFQSSLNFQQEANTYAKTQIGNDNPNDKKSFLKIFYTIKWYKENNQEIIIINNLLEKIIQSAKALAST